MTFKELIQSVTKNERRFVLWMIVVVIILTNAPYLMGLFKTPTNMIYNGAHFLDPKDYLFYYSKIEEVKQGNYLFRELYTSETQNIRTFNIFWLSVGLLAKWFKLSGPLALHLSRLLLTPLAIIIFYLAIAYFIKEIKGRKIAFILLLFSSGLDVLTAGFFKNGSPIDLWVAESNIFFTLSHSPHFIASTCLIILIFLFFLLSLDNQKWRYSLIAGGLALLLFQFHPYYFPTIFGVIAFYWLAKVIKDKKIYWFIIGQSLVIVLLSSPSLIYHFWLIKAEPIIAFRAMQNITLTPPFIYVVFGFGLPLFLAFWGMAKLKKIKDAAANSNNLLFAACWLIGGLILIYIPLNFQKRLLEGLQFPMIILAALTLISFSRAEKVKRLINRINVRLLVFFLFLLFFCLSSFYILIFDLVILSQSNNPEVKETFYLSKNELLAFDWLKNQTDFNAKILSVYYSGQNIPAYTARKVYFGNYYETIFFESKKQEVTAFFHDNNGEWRKNFLKKNQIDYLYYGPKEKASGSFEPPAKDYLKMVYSNDEVAIYQVVK